jgi:hypothetical protein
MIISRTHKFVYIGIPRTGSKSMCRWLMDHYDGQWVGGHHDWQVPADCRDYLIFTIVRNPYEIQASGWYFEPVMKDQNAPPKPKSYAEQCRNYVAPDWWPGGQKQYVERSGATQILFFEHLPECLKELPFVDPTNVPPFPHMNAGGYRPAVGNFFDLMQPEDEAIVWNGSREDFEYFGYRRYDCGAPVGDHPLRRASMKE